MLRGYVLPVHTEDEYAYMAALVCRDFAEKLGVASQLEPREYDIPDPEISALIDKLTPMLKAVNARRNADGIAA